MGSRTNIGLLRPPYLTTRTLRIFLTWSFGLGTSYLQNFARSCLKIGNDELDTCWKILENSIRKACADLHAQSKAEQSEVWQSDVSQSTASSSNYCEQHFRTHFRTLRRLLEQCFRTFRSLRSALKQPFRAASGLLELPFRAPSGSEALLELTFRAPSGSEALLEQPF